MIGSPLRVALLACVAIFGWRSPPLAAQGATGTSVAVSPFAGLGPVFDHGSHVGWSAHVLAELDVTRSRLRWSLFGSVRGIGAACADGCDLDGESVGVAVAYLFGSLGAGGGIGLLHQSGSWYAQPHAVLSAGRGTFRAQVRVEVPQGGYGVAVPILVGFRFPVG